MHWGTKLERLAGQICSACGWDKDFYYEVSFALWASGWEWHLGGVPVL